MNRRAQIVLGTALLLVGVTGLFGLQALGAPRPDATSIEVAAATPAATVASRQATTDTDAGSRQRVWDMMRDHMGLSASEADEWVDEMLEHMQAVHGDQTRDMLDYCAGRGDTTRDGSASGRAGWGGMMGGNGYGGMMGGWN